MEQAVVTCLACVAGIGLTVRIGLGPRAQARRHASRWPYGLPEVGLVLLLLMCLWSLTQS